MKTLRNIYKHPVFLCIAFVSKLQFVICRVLRSQNKYQPTRTALLKLTSCDESLLLDTVSGVGVVYSKATVDAMCTLMESPGDST